MAASRKSARRKPADAEKIGSKAEGLFAGYSEKKRPLGGYALLTGLFTVALGSAFAAAEASEDELPAINWSDLLLLGIATHKVTRVVTKDLVTSPFRAPFVKFKKSAGAGEVEEEARGEGLREAIGDLITCPYCMAPWVASTLVFAHDRAPRATRVLATIFSLTAASDFLNQLYAKTKG